MSSPKRQTIDFLLYPLVFVPIFIIPGIEDVFNLPKLWLLISLTVGIVIHYVVSFRQIKSVSWKLKRNLLVLILATNCTIVGCSFLTETTLSRILWGSPSRSNGVLYFICIFSLVGIASTSAPSSDFLKKSIRFIQIPLFVNLLYCSIQFLGKDPLPWVNPNSPIIGTFGNPNFSGAALGISCVFYLLLSLNSTKNWRLIYSILGLFSFYLSISTDSLQGPAIAVIGSLLILIQRISLGISRKKILAIFLSLFFVGAFFLSSFLGFGPVGSLLYQYTLRLRLDYWWIALQMALSEPLIGKGPDSYYEGYLLYRSENFVETYGVGLRADSAHSAPLNFLANFGFLSFALYFLLTAIITFFAIKLIFSWPRIGLEAQIFSFIWLLFLLQSMISIEQIGLGVMQWLSGGLVLHFSFNHSQYMSDEKKLMNKRVTNGFPTNSVKHRKLSVLGGELAVLSIAVSALLALPPLRDEIILKNIAQGNFQDAEVQNTITKEIQSLSSFALKEYRRARIVSNYYLNIGDTDSALAILRTLTAIDPESADTWLQIAKIENYMNRHAEEIIARKVVLVLDPLNYRNMLDLAKTYIKQGDQSLALPMLAEVTRLAKANVEAIEAARLLDELMKGETKIQN